MSLGPGLMNAITRTEQRLTRRDWLRIAGGSCVGVLLSGCGGKPRPQVPEVVVYSSVDDVYARTVTELFTRRTGLLVKLVSDTEETKSTGLLNRLLMERERPRADVFWSGDPVRTAILKHRGIAQPYFSAEARGLSAEYGDPQGYFAGFSARARVIIVNTALLRNEARPDSIFDFTARRFARRACIANPLFGTTSMHAAAIFQALGDEPARRFFDQLTDNGVRMLSSNGEVRRRVGAGDFAIGLADSDDVNVAKADGQPVDLVLPDQEGLGTLIIPNTAALIAQGPNNEGGRHFIDFLLSAEVERVLAESGAAQIPLRGSVPTPGIFGRSFRDIRTMKVDYAGLAVKLEELSTGFLKQWAEHQMNS